MSENSVIVIGGGVSGLTAAYRLHEEARERGLKLDVKLLEASDHLGGVIRTVDHGDCLLELGPDCFASNKPAGLEMTTELGLDDELIETNPAHRRSFILHKGKLKPLPQGFFLLAPMSVGALLKTSVISWPGKFRMALELLKGKKKTPGDESLADFVVRRFGKEALDRIAQPMIAGIYTADPLKLSLEATFPAFLEMEQEYGSVIKALRTKHKKTAKKGDARPAGPRYSLFVTFKRGMRVLTEALEAKLPEGCARKGVEVRSITRNGDGWRVELAGGESMDAAAVISALPAPRAAAIVEAANPALAGTLNSIPYAGAAVVNFIFERGQVKHPMDGIGCVIPAVEGRRIIAFSFSSVKFEGRAPEGKAIVRVFMGGALQPQLAAKSEEELTQIALEELRSLLGVEGEPLHSAVSRHGGAMAQYHIGHLEKVAKAKEQAAEMAGYALIGNGFDGIGIPDCIRNARAAAAEIVAEISKLRSGKTVIR